MFKNEKTKRTAIVLGIVFAVIYALLYLLIQAGYTLDHFSSFGETLLSVLTPIFVGGVIAYLLNPILRFFEKKLLKKMPRPRLRRVLSVILTYILILLLIIGVFSAILPQLISSVQDFGSNIDNYATALQTTLSSAFDDLNHYIDEHPSVRDLLENMGIYNWIGRIIEEEGTIVEPPAVNTDKNNEGSVTDPSSPTVTPSQKHELSFEAFNQLVTEKLSEFAASFSAEISNLANSLIELGFSFVNFLKNMILGIFISIYLLLSKERVAAQCKRFVTAIFPQKAASEILRLFRQSDRTVGRFVLGTIIDAVIVSVVTLILLTVFDIKYALLISLIIGITNMIPFFGPFIGSIPSALLLLLDDITRMVNYPDEPVRFTCITFVILMLIIQQIDGNIINPRVIGNSTGLSSLGVILSVTVMSGLFGFFGMLLGVPVAAIFITLGKELTEKRLAKKKLPLALAEYYPENSAVPPETPEEERESHEHTAFYRSMVAIHEKLRLFFRKIMYRNHGKSKSLKVWVNMKLGVRNVRHKVSHTIHPNPQKNEDTDESEKPSEREPSAEQPTDASASSDHSSDHE